MVCLDAVYFKMHSFVIFQERSKQERANLDIVWQLEAKNKEIQTLSGRIQKVSVIKGIKSSIFNKKCDQISFWYEL